MKYIMFKTEMAPNAWMFMPVIFPDVLTHSEVAVDTLGRLQQVGSAHRDWEVHSAGFYEGGKCYGESCSIDVASDPKDSDRVAAITEGETVIEVTT